MTQSVPHLNLIRTDLSHRMNRDTALYELRRALDAPRAQRTDLLAEWAETWGESAMREVMG